MAGKANPWFPGLGTGIDGKGPMGILEVMERVCITMMPAGGYMGVDTCKNPLN